MKLSGLEQALKDGCRIHAFRSGGGLRVVRVEKDGELRGYGEHPQVEDALSHANEDFLAGARRYEEVYGGSKPHYLTGSSTPSSSLDHWLLKGHTFDVWQDGAYIVFQLEGLAHVEAPKEILDRVLKKGGSEKWTHRGYTYLITRSNFPNGDPCTSSEIIEAPEGKKGGSDCWIYPIAKTGSGANLSDAIENALKAEEVEVERE